MSNHRTAFFVSDRTGITAEVLGRSLLTQFEGVPFHFVALPFIDDPEKAEGALSRIAAAAAQDGQRPIIFSTVVDPEIRRILGAADALLLDLFQIFIAPLEHELGRPSSHKVGRVHSASDNTLYQTRIDAINFTLAHDDGASSRDLARADLILVGVSRCGKTPTSLYLAMQFGIRAANYPLIPEDFEEMRLPSEITPYKDKLYGLTISADRLQQIRQERRPDSKYASLANCQREVRLGEALMLQEGIPFFDITTKSIEEIATTIMAQANLGRYHF